jgi:antitoxin component YwqK of YwqJK toxin-antitoxin module
MKNSGHYLNGQIISDQKGDTLTYYFENGDIKAQGKCVEGIFQGKWIFNKKEGYLWQVGNFDNDGRKHGPWIRYNRDGSVETSQIFEHGDRVKE